MLRVPRVTAVRLAVAAALGGFPGALGCTSILGIDGSYTVDTGGGGKSHPGADANGDGGAGGTGGAENLESGGTGEGGAGATGGTHAGGGGGTGGDADGSAPVGTGGVPPVSCRPGKYVGSIKGTHSASFTVIGFPLGVSGPLSFELTGAGGKLQIATGSGKIDGVLTGLPKGGPAALLASVEGTYDCSTHQLAGKLSGTVNAGLTPLEGTLTGDLTPANGLQGTWQEAEMTTSGPSPQFNGNGTWNAAIAP